MKLALLFSFFALATATWGQESFDQPYKMAEAQFWELRRSALHKVISRYKLSDPSVQAGIAQLAERETNDPHWEDLEEELAYENYYSEIIELCQKIATTYQNPAAWHAVLYSNYNEDSSVGRWLIAQPMGFTDIWSMAHSSTPFYAARGTILLAEAVARCSRNNIEHCSGPVGKQQNILELIRARIRAKDDVVSSAAIVALGVAGKPADIQLLQDGITELGQKPVASSMEEQSKASAIGLMKLSISKIEERETNARRPG